MKRWTSRRWMQIFWHFRPQNDGADGNRCALRKEALLEVMPPFLTGGEMIESVTREDAAYAGLPHKFEAGTVNGAGAVGLAAAIDYMNGIGMDAIQKREAELTKMLFDSMSKIPYVHILGSKSRRNMAVS